MELEVEDMENFFLQGNNHFSNNLSKVYIINLRFQSQVYIQSLS